MITIIQRGLTQVKFIRSCPKCETIFTYQEEDEEKIQPPVNGYTIECPICKDRYVTRNYYKNGTIAFDNRKTFGGDE